MNRPDRLIAKLSHAVPLSRDDEDELTAMVERVDALPAGTVIVEEGRPSHEGFVFLDGWAARERTLSDGSRQIVNFVVPGDLSEPGVFVTESADHTIRTLTPVRTCRFAHRRWFEVLASSPRLAVAMWWLASHEEAVLKEHVVSMGRRESVNRLLFLFWELWRRLTMAGLACDGRFHFPVGRADLADTLGMTPRHLSRVLVKVRNEDLVAFDRNWVTIRDGDALLKRCDCHDAYIQVDTISAAVREVLDGG